ncbi:hypothetical protein CHS0354_012632 [Potamilus streckersoni]|uniref:Cytochrome c oxidase assembly factor 5 n=1 Tax=Potamilus streckersoni TaxID=2493646 RepID=A0AAE0SXP0_9BIVA|nr:hypothetical protein CHS0354_012632 [Potamilus streckersoni]
MFNLEGKEGEKKPRKRACDGLRTRLKECLILSDCVQKDDKTPKECLNLKNDPSVPHECLLLRNAFYDCKRSIIDMRARFRGRKGD